MAPDVAVNCVAPGLVENTRMAKRLPEAVAEFAREGQLCGDTTWLAGTSLVAGQSRAVVYATGMRTASEALGEGWQGRTSATTRRHASDLATATDATAGQLDRVGRVLQDHATDLADLDSIALKALNRDPARRYPSAAAFGDDLRRFLAGRRRPWRSKRRRNVYSAAWAWCARSKTTTPSVAAMCGKVPMTSA